MVKHDQIRHTSPNAYFGAYGTANPFILGNHYVEMELGSPAQKFLLLVDPESELSWVNCAPCFNCEGINVHGDAVKFYDPHQSSTSSTVMCNQPFCNIIAQRQGTQCHSDDLCHYDIRYGDGRIVTRYFVRDTVQYNEKTESSGALRTNATIYFGCSMFQTREHQRSYEYGSGILGLGNGNISFINQLASSKNTPKTFAHCFSDDGGALLIGHVTNNKIRTTPLVSERPYYSVQLRSVEINGSPLTVDRSVYKSTVIDSGTTLAYLSEDYYQPIVAAIIATLPSKSYNMEEEEYCFYYNGSVDEAFPAFRFYFQGSAFLDVYPHDYLVHRPDNAWCIGWRDSGSISDKYKHMTILGELVLMNKLVVYNLEKQIIGWRDYDCTNALDVKFNGASTVDQPITRKICLFLVSVFTPLLLHFTS